MDGLPHKAHVPKRHALTLYLLETFEIIKEPVSWESF